MYSSEDLEKLWFLYKLEGQSQNLSIESFCTQQGVLIKHFIIGSLDVRKPSFQWKLLVCLQSSYRKKYSKKKIHRVMKSSASLPYKRWPFLWRMAFNYQEESKLSQIDFAGDVLYVIDPVHTKALSFYVACFLSAV